MAGTHGVLRGKGQGPSGSWPLQGLPLGSRRQEAAQGGQEGERGPDGTERSTRNEDTTPASQPPAANAEPCPGEPHNPEGVRPEGRLTCLWVRAPPRHLPGEAPRGRAGPPRGAAGHARAGRRALKRHRRAVTQPPGPAVRDPRSAPRGGCSTCVGGGGPTAAPAPWEPRGSWGVSPRVDFLLRLEGPQRVPGGSGRLLVPRPHRPRILTEGPAPPPRGGACVQAALPSEELLPAPVWLAG